jgi:hypothetical protein
MPLPKLPRGLAAYANVLTGEEDSEEFFEFRQRMLAELDPWGPEENLLAEEIVTEYWRLNRVPAAEARILTRSKRVISELAQLSLHEMRLLGALEESRAALRGLRAGRGAAA